MNCQQNVRVRVYKFRPPYFDKLFFSYTKKFCDINEAKEWVASCEMADINFNNYMGYCRRDRRFFKLAIITEKKKPFEFNYIAPQLARNY